MPIQDCEEVTRPSALLSPTKVRYLPKALIELREKVMDPLNFLDLALGPRRVLRALLAFSSKDHFFDWVFPSRTTLAAEAHLGSLPTLYRHLKTLETKGYIVRRQLRDDAGSYSMSHVQFTDKAAALLGVRKSGVGRDGGFSDSLSQPKASLGCRRSRIFRTPGEAAGPLSSQMTSERELSSDNHDDVDSADFVDQDASLQSGSSFAVNEFMSSDGEFIMNSTDDFACDHLQAQISDVANVSTLHPEFHTFDGFPQKPCVNVIGGVYKSERTRSEQLKGSADSAPNPTRSEGLARARLRDRRRDSDIDPDTRLPRELVGLLQHLNRSTVCYLMKLCRLHNKRLGDIWAVQKAYIHRMKGSVAGFLVSEIKKDIDYGWIRAQKAQNDAASPGRAQVVAERPRRLNALAEELLAAGQGRAVMFGEVQLGAISLTDKAVLTRRGVIPINGRFVSEWLDGLYAIEGLSGSLESGISFV